MADKHAKPERYPTNDKTEQRMREDAEKGKATDQTGKHDKPSK